MERLNRTWTGCGLALALLVAGEGCRNVGPEVPRGKAFSPDGTSNPPIGLNNAPHASTAIPSTGPANAVQGMNSGPGQLGTPAPGSAMYGMPTDNGYGSIGSSGLAAPTPAVGSIGSVANPSTGIPQTGTGPSGPAAATATPGQASVPTQSPF